MKSLLQRKPQKKSPKKPRKDKHAERVSPGLRFEARVRDLTSAGDGVVAHESGLVVFVPGVWIGEVGEFEVTASRGRGAVGRLLTLLEPHPGRRQSPCPYQGHDQNSCGGCPWMFMSYQQQVAAKYARLQQALSSFSPDTRLPTIIPAPLELGYRNRAQLKTDGRVLGFVAGNERSITPVDDCLVLNEHNRHTLRALQASLPDRDLRPGRRQDWTRLDIDDDLDASEVVANERRPFRQGNSAQNARMRDWLAEQLQQLPAQLHIVELFAGSGNFTELLATARAASITAVDSFLPAVQVLDERRLAAVETRCLNLDRVEAAQTLERELARAELLVLDPPRAGLKTLPEYLELAANLHSILYISCDLASFSRDTRAALEAGFVLEEVQGIDLFPQTPHIELLARLRRPR